MRIAACCTVLAFSALTATAQSVTPCAPGVMAYSNARVSSGLPQNGSLPYTATIQTTYEQKLADGNRIKQTEVSIEARDVKGRTVHINPMSCYPDASGQPQLYLSISVSDPGNHSNSSWTTGPGSLGLVNINNSTSAAIDWKNIQRTPFPHDTSQNANFHREDLGSQTIAGLTASGTRFTHTLPTGFAGNDLPIETVREEWVALPAHLVLMSVNDDPRSGKTTWKVTSFTQGDPDPKLFEPPANYAIRNLTSTETVETAAPAQQP